MKQAERIRAILEQSQPPTEEELQILHDGELFESFVRGETWKKLLDFLVELDEKALAGVMMNRSSDPMVSHTLQCRLQERRFVLNEVQNYVLGTIEQRKELLKSQQPEKETNFAN